MNKLLTILIFIGMTGLVVAKDINPPQHNPQIPFSIEGNEKPAEFVLPSYSGKNNSTQDLEGTQITYFQRFWWSHFAATTPISYDPTTDAVGVLVSDLVFNPTLAGSKVFMLRTTNKGTSWDSLNVFRNPLKTVLYGSLAFNNPTKSTDVSDVSYVASFQKVWKDTTYDQDDGAIFAVYEKSFGEPVPIEELSPVVGNPPDTEYWANVKMNTNTATNTIYGTGTLSNASDNDRYGYYGFWRFDYTKGLNYSSTPTQWWANKFKVEDEKRVSSNSTMNTIHDEAGTLYSVVNNNHFENQETRLMGVSKSTDNGTTWSDFEIMPEEILNSLLDNHIGYTSIGISYPFGNHALFSRGVGKLSYLTNVVISGQDVEVLRFLCELTYDNGIFGIKDITNLYSAGPPTTSKEPTTPFNPDVYTIRYRLSSYGNNIQTAKTVDGDKVVAMWIDADPEKLIPMEPTPILVNQRNSLTGAFEDVTITLDTILKYDIYSSIYDMNDGTWSDPVNISDDDSVDTYFNMPSIIPSVKRVPFLSYEAVRTNRTNAFNFPKPIIHMLVDDVSVVKYVELDATITQPKGPVNSVKEVLDFNVELGDAYPNPAVNANQVGITFTVDELAVVTLELFDNMGNKVETIYNDKSTIGYKAINANISNLTSGTYYYQLSVNGVSFTKKLVVVK